MNCRICNNTEGNRQYNVKEMMFGINEFFSYFKCAKCGCLQIAQIPDDMKKYYPESYYSYSSLEKTPIYKDVITKFTKANRDFYTITGKGIVGRLLSLFKKRDEFMMLSGLGLNRDSRIIDVGCGSGGKLYSLRNAGFKNVLGVDPFIGNEIIKYKNGLEIHKKDIFEVSGKWDLIMLNHSYEHMEKPQAVMDKISGLLSDNGTCIIRIPLCDSYAFETYGVNWVQLDAPRHFFLHTVKSISLMADTAQLKVNRVNYEGDEFQFWASEQYIKGVTLTAENSYAQNREKSGFSEAVIQGYKEKARGLNKEEKGDAAAFYLVKK